MLLDDAHASAATGAYLGDCERVREIGAGALCDAHAGVAKRLRGIIGVGEQFAEVGDVVGASGLANRP